MEVILEMPFQSRSNVDVEFAELRKLTWSSYIAVTILSTTSWVELISKKEFAKAALNKNFKIFVVYSLILEATTIHPSQAAQIAVL